MFHVTNRWIFGFFDVTENPSNPNNVTGFENRENAEKMADHLNQHYDEICVKQPDSEFRKMDYDQLHFIMSEFRL